MPVCQFCGLVDPVVCAYEEQSRDCRHVPTLADGLLAGLRRMHYGVVYADPPWAYKTFSDSELGTVPHRSEEAPYRPMSLDELKAMPVSDIAARDCVLHMWTISSHLDQSLDLGRSWGFTYKSIGLVWVKTQKGDPETPKMGMGKWFRQEAEICLLFTRGKPSRESAGVRQTILEPAREHSRKPDAAYERIEALSAGPYVELFSRKSRPGWDAMGNEKGKFDALDPLEEEEIGALV